MLIGAAISPQLTASTVSYIIFTRIRPALLFRKVYWVWALHEAGLCLLTSLELRSDCYANKCNHWHICSCRPTFRTQSCGFQELTSTPICAGRLAKHFPWIFALQSGGVGLTWVNVVYLLQKFVMRWCLRHTWCCLGANLTSAGMKCNRQTNLCTSLILFWSLYSDYCPPKKKVTSCGLCCIKGKTCSSAFVKEM